MLPTEPKKKRAPISLAVTVILTLFSLGLMLTAGDYLISERVISSDVISYYNYLPAVFKYHSFDFANLPMRAGFVTADNGIVAEKMTSGVAILYLPFYLLAWAWVSIAGMPYQEYSMPFSLMISLSAQVYFLLGMLFLRKVLLRFFSDTVVSLGLIGVFLGTNLLHYTAYAGPMSHVYSFFLISVFLWLMIRWHEKATWMNSLLLGLIAGWIVLIRPSNVGIIFLALLWNMYNRETLLHKIHYIRQHFLKLFILALGALLIWLPQMLYWKSVSGHYLYFSYQGEGFFFASPKILWGLFAYRNGWLLYSPIMFFAIAGFFLLRKKLKVFLIPILIYFLFSIYFIFSWWCWWYVGCGLRAMIDLYPVLAVPLCATIAWILQRKKWLMVPLITIWSFFLLFGMFKNYQFKKGIIHFDSMTGPAYRAALFSMDIPPNNYYMLLKTPDYEAAVKGENKTLP